MKKINIRLAVISTVLTFVSLIVLPRIPLKVDSSFLQLDSYIGGYKFSLFNGRFAFDTTSYSTGIALAGGTRLVLHPDLDSADITNRDTIHDEIKDIIEERISSLGASDTNVYINRHTENPEIIVEYPAIYEGSGFAGLVSQRGSIAFKTLKEDLEWTEESYIQHVYNPEAWVDTEITNSDLLGVDYIPGETAQIRLRFSDVGRAKFSYVAKNNIERPIALYIDEGPFPISLPIVSKELAEGLVGDPIISGNFDNVTAKRMSIQLGAGSLPVNVDVVSEEDIPPVITIRQDGVFLFALLVGLVVVFMYLLVRYKKLGLLALISLLSYLITIIAVSRLSNIIITIPVLLVYIFSVIVEIDFTLTLCEFLVKEYSKNRPRNLFIKEAVSKTLESFSGFFILIIVSIIYFFIIKNTGLGSSFLLVLSSGAFSYYILRTFIEIFTWEKPFYERKRK